MPTHRQRTVDIVPTPGSLGGRYSTSDSAQISEIFPASPIHNGTVTVEERRKFFMDNVLSAVINDGGHTFGTVSTDYVLAPDMASVDLRTHNLPSAYAPNPVSPGPGSQNDSDKGPPPEGFAQNPSETYGSGVGSRLTPKSSSERTARQTLGDYIFGKSSPESGT
jgi:hypothetical protein